MMTNFPVAGVVWQTIHYLIGLQRLGYDVYYVETHACTPSKLMEGENDDGSARAAAYIAGVMERFDLADRWAFYAPHENDRCYGLSRRQLLKLYSSASLLINLHAGTMPLPELAATDRLVLLETDPVELQVELHDNLQETIDFLESHCAYFTFAENYGNPDCKLPVLDRFSFRPTRQPIVLDFWREGANLVAPRTFTTVGNWWQPGVVTLHGKTYSWSKSHEFLKFLELPYRTGQSLELALSSYEESDRRMLESKGWRVRRALDFSEDTDAYRDYILRSRGEFTVAKEQNVRLNTGWFSDRSATYLAAGRPVVTQETGFSNILPTGEGLLGFSTLDEAVAAVEAINSDYDRHAWAAAALAADHFSHDVVLPRLLEEVGVEISRRGGGQARKERGGFPEEMVLTPVSRLPTRLSGTTIETVLSADVPVFNTPSRQAGHASIVIVTYGNLVFTRLCLETLLGNTEYPHEVIVIDNGSSDGTADYIQLLAANQSNVHAVLNGQNVGFARACNQGLALATGEVLVLLNNDTMVPPGWLTRLVSKLEDPDVGLVGPVTNRIANEAQIDTTYETWGECLRFAEERAEEHEGEVVDISVLAMFCVAMRRDVYERVGPLDERFQIGMFEDDDYSMRMRAAGYRVICATEAFIHHFGESSFGKLVPTGEHSVLLKANRTRFEEKWGVTWQPHGRRNPQYDSLAERIRQLVAEVLPPEATVLVVSKGDEQLLKLHGRPAWHFPAAEDGAYTGHHPADSREAINRLEALRARGGQFLVIPKTGLWWLDHYKGLRQHLETRYRAVVREEDTCVIFALNGQGR
jgi:GT2 family glycosyltransferase